MSCRCTTMDTAKLPICALYLKNEIDAIEQTELKETTTVMSQDAEALIQRLQQLSTHEKRQEILQSICLVTMAYHVMPYEDWEYVVELLITEIEDALFLL